MSPIQSLSIAALAPLILMMALLGFTAQRSGLRAMGCWLAAWSALLAAAWMNLWSPVAPAVHPIAFLFSSLVGPLMLLGAYEHTERDPPSWILPAGFVLGVTRLAMYQLGHPGFAYLIAMLCEPAFALAAAGIVSDWSKRRVRPLSGGEKLLGLAFLPFAGAELVDASARLVGVLDSVFWSGWIACSLPLFTLQCAQQIRRLGRSQSEKRQATAAYAQRLAILTEASEDVVVEYDDHGVITYLSPNVATLGGRGEQDMLGRRIDEFFGGEERSSMLDAVRRGGRLTEEIVASSDPTSASVTMSDGSKRWYESMRTTYRTPDGELRVLARTHDVSDRVGLYDETRERERRLNQAEEIANLGSWEYYAKERKTYCSAQLFRMVGLEPREGPVDEDSIKSLVHPDDLGQIFGASLERLPASGVTDVEYRVSRFDDGRSRILRVRGEIERDDDGEVKRVIGATMDVTERLELEERLRRGQEHFRMFFDADIVGVFYSDLEGRIPEANDAFLAPLGYTKADLPLDWIELSVRAQKPRDEQAIDEIRRTGAALPYEKEFLSATGDPVPMLIGCAQIEAKQALVIAVDLSERKRAEAYIARHQKELEDTVAARTQELMESRGRLIENERLAAVGTLAAGVAHQINNPVGAILNSAEYALLCREEATAQQIFEKALRANLSEARRCAQIIRSMLQFSRDETTIKWTEDLGLVVRRAQRAVNAYAMDRDARIHRKEPDRPVLARISPIEIEQALVNVLRNAVESRIRGATVSIELSERDKTAEIEVVDDGRGIAAEIRDHLFEPFYSTRTRDGGTGLGLSVAHGIISDHGGEIRIDSAPAEGTRVLITLPTEEAESADSEAGAGRPDAVDSRRSAD